MADEYLERPQGGHEQHMQHNNPPMHHDQNMQFPPMHHDHNQNMQFPSMHHDHDHNMQFPPMHHDHNHHGNFPPFGGVFLIPFAPGPYNFGQYAPNMYPPSYIPHRPMHHPGPIRLCVGRFAYIWFHDGRNFWAWISYVSRHTIYGYRWNGYRWVYFEADINDIDIFICV